MEHVQYIGVEWELHSPQGRHSFFFEYRRRTIPGREVDGAQKGFGLGIVRNMDASALPLRPIKALPSIGPVSPVRSIGCSDPSRASSTSSAARSSGSPWPSVCFHCQ